MNLTVLRSPSPTYPDDYDPGAFVSDGSEIVGFLVADNFGGTISARRYQDAGNHGTLVEALDVTTGIGYPSIGESFDVYGKITLVPDSTDVDASFFAGSASHVFAQPIDRTQPFSFIFLGHDADEPYQLNSLSIEISGQPVPEPSTLALAAVGLASLGLITWRCRRLPELCTTPTGVVLSVSHWGK